MRKLILLLMSFAFLHSNAQTTFNQKLQKELDSILVADQKYREVLSNTTSAMSDSLASVYHQSKTNINYYIWTLQTKIDSANIIRIKQIIDQHGYPGKSLVGTPANEAAFYVIQHSLVIDTYLPIVKKAAEADELPFRLYAMMLDRSLMEHNQEQIYGTQASGFMATNNETGKKQWTVVIWPIKDAKLVNQRRKQAGFDQTVEENAKRLGVDYKVLTLQDVKKLKTEIK
ncbi:hypothetical protein GS399_16810 [Pedobacter sp. HMF7647]|uniref:GLPGLI family protein n=1 Tax=Hufsiella arboris TaxID=2695275 RepID=A0A7K1YDG6_9SPHI|nr:DUF6624 domain-containing protein [Hufsiella arboris]MXV52637.1 hypothetical protein [Hufsiella arboris]